MQKGLLFPVLVILFGLLLLLKNVFNWNISLFKVFFGIAVIAIGISLLTGGFKWFRDGVNTRQQSDAQYAQGMPSAGAAEDVVFANRSYTATQSCKFSYVFSGGTIDLTQLPPGQHTFSIDSVFAGVTVYVKAGADVRVNGSAAFGQVRLPNGDAAYFGSVSRGGNAEVTITASAVFGSVEIFER